jgi:hypothetical protein
MNSFPVSDDAIIVRLNASEITDQCTLAATVWLNQYGLALSEAYFVCFVFAASPATRLRQSGITKFNAPLVIRMRLSAVN